MCEDSADADVFLGTNTGSLHEIRGSSSGFRICLADVKWSRAESDSVAALLYYRRERLDAERRRLLTRWTLVHAVNAVE